MELLYKVTSPGPDEGRVLRVVDITPGGNATIEYEDEKGVLYLREASWVAKQKAISSGIQGSAGEIGRKDDKGKPTWRLLYTFLPELEGVVDVLEAGAVKYSPGNWEFVKDGFNRYGEAGRRHLLASLAGEERDPDSGSYHELHVIASMLFRLARRRLGK